MEEEKVLVKISSGFVIKKAFFLEETKRWYARMKNLFLALQTEIIRK